jgi:hypothetical protein
VRAAPGEVLETLPGALVRVDERIEVHVLH